MAAALATLLLAITLTLDPGSGALSLEVDGERLADVVAALRSEAGANLIVDAALEERRLSLAGRYADLAAAVRAVAEQVGADVEESGGVFLLRRRTRKPEPPRLFYDGLGKWRAPEAIPYIVQALLDTPEHATVTAHYDGFERRGGVSLVAQSSLRDRAIREYLERRDIYRAILDKAGLEIEIKGDLADRDGRVYVEPGRGRYYVEFLYAQGERGAEIAHWVFVVDARTSACEKVVVFKTRARKE